MLESLSLQKNRLRCAKNVIFSSLCILVDRPMGGGLNPQNPPCIRPCAYLQHKIFFFAKKNDSKKNLAFFYFVITISSDFCFQRLRIFKLQKRPRPSQSSDTKTGRKLPKILKDLLTGVALHAKIKFQSHHLKNRSKRRLKKCVVLHLDKVSCIAAYCRNL